MSKYRCVFRNCNTINTPGKGVMPPACAAKMCTGKFDKMPKCRTFMRDALPPEPIIKINELEFTRITPNKNGFHLAPIISRRCKRYPTRAVMQA
ncbi:MAG: hypothetical protein GY852_04165 [bacterium]|nr:hypothetical protein [bacterium]